MKKCKTCERQLDLDSFYERRGGQRGRVAVCKECISASYFRLRANRTRAKGEKKPLTTRPCAECGVAFLSKIDRARLCSANCRAAAGVRERGTHTCSVPDCAEPALSKGWCRAHYLRARRYGDPLLTSTRRADAKAASARQCTQCETTFIPMHAARNGQANRNLFCSRACRHLSMRVHTTLAVERRVRSRRRDAKVKAASDPAQPINKAAIFERDGWKCYLCGEETDRAAHWRHPRAPSLDHATPLSRGGAHTPDNLLCAHRGCNTLKGAKSWHEILLA